MKVLRITVYPTMDRKDAFSGFVPEFTCHNFDILIDDIQRTSPPFLVTELFEMPATHDPEEIIAAGHRRLEDSARAQDEINMAVAYHWNGEALGRVRAGGTLSATKAAPLSREQILLVFKQLERHPNYRDQTIIQIDRHGEIVRLDPPPPSVS